jgi:ribosomal protein L11 methyltransferase
VRAQRLHHIQALVRGADAAEAILAILDAATGAVAAFETGPASWRLDAYPNTPMLTAQLRARLALAAAGAGGELLRLEEAPLRETDWLADNQLAFPPLRIDRFFIRGSHFNGRVPVGAIGILLDAATAFGTGEHASTRGCLTALGMLARRRPIRRPLDIGTGTGILAIAAAKLSHRRVLARDIDGGAVSVARHNAARNGVAQWVRVERGAGCRGRPLRRHGYDLILANILARPLAVMACDFARQLAPGGHLVLAGLLQRQEPIVMAPHRTAGFALVGRIIIDGWSTLLLRAGSRAGDGAGARSLHL